MCRLLLNKSNCFLSWSMIGGLLLALISERAAVGGGASGARKDVGGAGSFLIGFSSSGDEDELLFCGITESDEPTGRGGNRWSCLCFAAMYRLVRFIKGRIIAIKKLMLLQFATSCAV